MLVREQKKELLLVTINGKRGIDLLLPLSFNTSFCRCSSFTYGEHSSSHWNFDFSNHHTSNASGDSAAFGMSQLFAVPPQNIDGISSVLPEHFRAYWKLRSF